MTGVQTCALPICENTGTAYAKINKLKIVDLLQNTFYNYGEIEELTVTDGGGTRIMNDSAKAKIGNLVIDAASKMVLVNKGTMDRVTVKRANSIEVRQETGSKPITDLVSEKADLNVVIRFENPKADNNVVTNVIANTKNCIVKDTAGTDFTDNVTAITKAIDAEFAKLKETVLVSGSSVNIKTSDEVYKDTTKKLTEGSLSIGGDETCTVAYTFATKGNYFEISDGAEATGDVTVKKDVSKGATEILTITATATDSTGKKVVREYTIKLQKD